MQLQVLDVDQVAQLLRCADTTVRERATELGGLKLGRDWVFPAGALSRRLDELALASSVAPKAPAPTAVLLRAVPAGKRGRRQPPYLPALP